MNREDLLHRNLTRLNEVTLPRVSDALEKIARSLTEIKEEMRAARFDYLRADKRREGENGVSS